MSQVDETEEVNCSPFEKEVLAIINLVRRDVGKCFALILFCLDGAIKALEDRIGKFIPKTNKFMLTPKSYIMTNEGVEAVQSAIKFLKERKAAGIVSEELIWSDEAYAVCSRHTLKNCSAGPDSCDLFDEADTEKFKSLFEEEFGGQEKVGGFAECHDFGSFDPIDVILTLIIDDGNESRSNRTSLFGNWDYVGLSSREHPKFKRMTSILFVVAEDSVDKELNTVVKAAEAMYGLEEGKSSKLSQYDWISKKTRVAVDPKGAITVTFTLILADGTEKVLEYSAMRQ